MMDKLLQRGPDKPKPVFRVLFNLAGGGSPEPNQKQAEADTREVVVT